MSKTIPPVRAVAWCHNDRPGMWHECQYRPMPYQQARDLLAGKDPRHIFAQRRDNEAKRTYLVHKPAMFSA